MRTVFAGTPEFACPSLGVLLARDDIELVGVYCQPDRPAGRGRKLAAGPVKTLALAAGVPVYQPSSFKTPEVLASFAELEAQLLVVVAYGLILPRAALAIPTHAINVHASLLPRWRGAAPIPRAIMAGDVESGISIMRMVERLDAGPVWLARSCTIEARETGGTLHDRLAGLGGVALAAALDELAAGTIEEVAQNELEATYAEKITQADRVVDWSHSAQALDRQIRALAPRPGVRAKLGKLEVKLLEAEVVRDGEAANPGDIVSVDASGIVVATGEHQLRIRTLQPAGKQHMSAEAFINGYGNLL